MPRRRGESLCSVERSSPSRARVTCSPPSPCAPMRWYSLATLDLQLPPLSPSPPPAAAATAASTSAELATASSSRMDIDGASTTETDADADADADADGEEADADGSTDATPTTGAGTPALQQPIPPVMVVQPPSTAGSVASGTASPKLMAVDAAAGAREAGEAGLTSTPLASTSALPYTPPAALNGVGGTSLSPNPAPPSTISPSLLAGAPPSTGATSPLAAGGSTPYTTLFPIPAILPTYPSTLPLLPPEVHRNRLNGSVRKKGKEKALQAPPPDLYKMQSKAVHMGVKNFLGRGKRVHNVLSTHDWGVSRRFGLAFGRRWRGRGAQGRGLLTRAFRVRQVGLEELRAIRAFDKIEQLKADKAWSFRQPKKQRVGLVPKAHWDHVMDEMVRSRPSFPSLPRALKLTLLLRRAHSGGYKPTFAKNVAGRSPRPITSPVPSWRGIALPPRQRSERRFASR